MDKMCIRDRVTLYNWMTLNYPNIYCIFQKAGNEPEAYENFSIMAILLTMFILAVGCTYAVKKKMVEQKVDLLGLSTWCLFTCVQILPAMHERYGFPAEIMAVCYAFIRKDKWGFLVAFLINGSISINYIALVFNGCLLYTSCKYVDCFFLCLLVISVVKSIYQCSVEWLSLIHI